MLRKVVGPIACCLFLTWGVPAAPRKDDPASSYYSATKVGDKLVYEDKRGSQSEEYVIEVIEARQKGAAMLVTVLRGQDDWKSEPWRNEISDRGAWKVAKGDAVFESPKRVLRLPFLKGDTWETSYWYNGERVTGKYTSADEEEIEVPAGRFRCLRVEAKSVIKGDTWTDTFWWAPRVGIVKEELVDNDNRPKLTSVLKSFTPGDR
jgi:hypothetical protein